MALASALRWDLFCRVIDNFGDIGVCWRLARQLAAAGDEVRLVVDDDSALAWMAPPATRPPRLQVLPWPGPAEPAPVVVEAFGCELPPAYVGAMRARDPVWINLEYLSAEGYVERSHRLPSPRPDGLRKWFFYPGFTAGTGGLLREPGLMAARAAFDAPAWLAARGWAPRPGERVASLFGYANPMLPELLGALAAQPTLLLAAPGPAQASAVAAAPAGLRVLALPWLAHDDYDRLLWSCALNAVRGEDSLVRALWAGAPLLWQAYPQHDGAHAAKVAALAARLALPPEVARCWQAWNGLAPWAGLPATDPDGLWARAMGEARAALLAQADLASQLRAFVLSNC